MFRPSIRWFLALSASLAASSAAFAQTDPGSLERTVPKFEPKRAEKQPRVAAPVLPSPQGARIAGTFVLSAVNIEGSTVFTSEQLAQSFEPYLASQVGQAELERIASDITERYRRAGYVLSYATIPEQPVQSGIVRIRVIEGFIDHVNLEGDRKSALAIRALVARLSQDKPLRAETLERVLGLARETPGVVMGDVRISRTPDDPARHQLTIALGADRTRGLLYSDNRGTSDGARIRGYSSFTASSLAVPGDQLQVDLFGIPTNDFRYFYGQAKASVPLNSDGLRLSLSASYGDEFQRFFGPNQDGTSRQFVADLSFPFVRTRTTSVTVHFAISDWKSEEKLGGAAFQRDRLQVARAWAEFVRASKTRIEGRLGISRGLDFGPPREPGNPLASRPFGDSEFTKLNADFGISAPVSDRVTLRFDSSAQVSFDPLLAPEEFALGGSRIGRAFDFNEVTGDHGVGGMLELSYHFGDVGSGVKALELFAFADGGGVFRKRPSPGFLDEAWLASAGAGTRFATFGLVVGGEVGLPVARSGAPPGVRAFFSVTKPF